MTEHVTNGRTGEDDGADTRELFPIRTVSALTGVNVVTLRAWERRYGLIEPKRTPSGHRLYSQEDVDLINEVVRLLDRGISIGRVKEALRSRQQPDTPRQAEGEDVWSRYRNRLLTAISRFDEAEVDEVYNQALSLYPIDLVVRHLIVPLLEQLGQRWKTMDTGVAEEHFFAVILRNKLGARLHQRERSAQGKRLLCACLPEEQHEFGLLLFGLSAQAYGLRPVLLGANMPMASMPAAARQAQCDAIVLAGTFRGGDADLQSELAFLTQAVDVPVFVGGSTSVAQLDEIVRAGAVPLGEDIGQGIRKLMSVLEPA